MCILWPSGILQRDYLGWGYEKLLDDLTLPFVQLFAPHGRAKYIVYNGLSHQQYFVVNCPKGKLRKI